jgi:CBS domain-containing protein
MTGKVEVCRPTDSMRRAVQIMREKDCGSVPVVDERTRVVGIITDRDICLASDAAGKNLAELRVVQGMASDVECCGPDDTIADAEKKLRTRKVRRLPVVDRKRRLVGILSVADLALATERKKKKKVGKAEVGRTLASISRPPDATETRRKRRPAAQPKRS